MARDPEILIEGPANTGKTTAVLLRMHADAERYPQSRQLMLRETRASLTESVLVSFEKRVVAENHPCLAGASRAQRHAYVYPNGSEIVTGGLDNADRLFSSEWDRIVFFEARECSEDSYEKASSRLRNKRFRDPGEPPEKAWHQFICDTNPDSPGHWLNQRANAGKMRRMLSRHEDNPACTEQDLQRLRNLTGVRRLRFYEGVWAESEGAIWSFNAGVHGIDAGRLCGPDTPVNERNGRIVIRWYFAAQDWGFANPGCLMVFGVDSEGVMYCVHQVYQRGRTAEWWTERAVALEKKYRLQKIVCDHESPEHVFHYRRAGLPAVPADKGVRRGLDAVAHRLQVAQGTGKPRLFFVKGSLEAPDTEAVERHEPTCFEEEVSSYVWRRSPDGRLLKEEPDPRCADHACDTVRYAVMEVDREADRGEKDAKFQPMTYGSLLKHEEVFAE